VRRGRRQNRNTEHSNGELTTEAGGELLVGAVAANTQAFFFLFFVGGVFSSFSSVSSVDSEDSSADSEDDDCFLFAFLPPFLTF